MPNDDAPPQPPELPDKTNAPLLPSIAEWDQRKQRVLKFQQFVAKRLRDELMMTTRTFGGYTPAGGDTSSKWVKGPKLLPDSKQTLIMSVWNDGQGVEHSTTIGIVHEDFWLDIVRHDPRRMERYYEVQREILDQTNHLPIDMALTLVEVLARTWRDHGDHPDFVVTPDDDEADYSQAADDAAREMGDF